MTRSETLDKAKACVCGQRENEYGSPEDNFTAIAGFWSVYKGVEFSRRSLHDILCWFYSMRCGSLYR